MLSRVKLPVLILSACLGGLTPSLAAGGYAMYVWKLGFDSTIPGCDAAKLLAWDPACLTHNWKSAQSRHWLWDTANRQGRKIDHLFVSGVIEGLKAAYIPATAALPDGSIDCPHPRVLEIRGMLLDGHREVSGVAIYALSSVGDSGVTEQTHVPLVVLYNNTCAQEAPNARFDGFAVNNEAWNGIIKDCSTAATNIQAYLNNLQKVADAAGNLPTHYSIGFGWNKCGKVNWGPPGSDPTVKYPTEHMIDIFDSVDVQVATIDATTAANRARQAGYNYASGLPKPFYVDSRANKPVGACQRGTCVDGVCRGGSNNGTNCTSNSQCALGICADWTNQGTCTNDTDCTCATTTHFPHCDDVVTLDPRTDHYMMTQVFDQFSDDAINIPAALPAIHAFREVYSSGGHDDWPSWESGSLSADFQGFLTFANPHDKLVISWPAQGGATAYQLARANRPTFDDDDDVVCQPASATSAVVATEPNPSSVFFYLVQALDLAGARGWGETATGELRSFSCP